VAVSWMRPIVAIGRKNVQSRWRRANWILKMQRVCRLIPMASNGMW
jgi:hypothetical protein